MKLFFKALRTFIIVLTLQRLLFLILFFSRWENRMFFDLVKSELTGLRFDLMVSGYCLVPFLILFFPGIQKRVPAFKFLFKGTLILFLLLLVVIGFLDLQWYHVFSDRFSSAQSMDQFLSAWTLDGFLFLSLAGTAVVVFTGGNYVRNIKITKTTPLKYKFWFLLVLIVGVIIRGSFDEYHLDLRHANVTFSKFLNLSAVASPYAMDQALRGRR